MLKHLSRSSMDFLLNIFNLSWFLHSFPSIWKTFSIIPIHKVEKLLDSPASFWPISLTFGILNISECIILLCLLLFLESNSILAPCQASFYPLLPTLNEILFLSQSILNGFNKRWPSSQMILATIDFSKAFDYVWHFPLFANSFGLASLLALLVGLSLSFLIGMPAWFFKITKVTPFESVKVFFMDLLLVLHFFSFHQ